jgi:outer membrane protein
MKNLSTVLSSLAFIGVCILGFMQMKSTKKVARKAKVVSSSDSNVAVASAGNLAYVNYDSLEANYGSYKKKKAEFEAMDKNLGQELERMQTALQNEYIELQKKAQAGQMTQEQGEAAGRRLQQRQQELEMKKQNEGAALIKKTEEFNKKLQDEMQGFLEEFASEKGYDFVFAYTKPSSLLYVNPDLDITADVLDALNSGKSYAKKDDKKEDKKSASDSAKTK